MGRLIGITGGIGAGKSVVSRILRLKGYPVYDTDSRAKQLMDADIELKLAMQQRWGVDVLNPDGGINRPRVAEVIFGSDEERLWLNSQVHALVGADISRWTADGFTRGLGLMFVESAILATSQLDRVCDEIWVVDAPEAIRVQRALDRGGIPLENILGRIKAQQQELAALPADKVRLIDNGFDSALLPQIDILLETPTPVR